MLGIVWEASRMTNSWTKLQQKLKIKTVSDFILPETEKKGRTSQIKYQFTC